MLLKMHFEKVWLCLYKIDLKGREQLEKKITELTKVIAS